MTHCKYCGKKTLRPKFCCNKHKDRYHNEHNPRGYYKHLKQSDEIVQEEIEDSMHPGDPYSLGAG